MIFLCTGLCGHLPYRIVITCRTGHFILYVRSNTIVESLSIFRNEYARTQANISKPQNLTTEVKTRNQPTKPSTRLFVHHIPDGTLASRLPQVPLLRTPAYPRACP